jgi:hypothetical protein
MKHKAGPLPASEPAFDEAESVRKNEEWFARERAQRERRRTRHNAVCEVQRMTPAQQRQWLSRQRDPDLRHAVLHQLHPEVLLELLESNGEKRRRRVAEQEKRDKARPRRIADVEAFLLRALARGRRVPAKEVTAEALQAGISRRTLHRAKAKLRVRTKRVGFGPRGHFVWFLPVKRH